MTKGSKNSYNWRIVQNKTKHHQHPHVMWIMNGRVNGCVYMIVTVSEGWDGYLTFTGPCGSYGTQEGTKLYYILWIYLMNYLEFFNEILKRLQTHKILSSLKTNGLIDEWRSMIDEWRRQECFWWLSLCKKYGSCGTHVVGTGISMFLPLEKYGSCRTHVVRTGIIMF